MKNNQLMIDIASCEEVTKAKADINHPCHKIVNSQTGKDFQIPEPYNGHIETADILFISSNPSYDEKENYPTQIQNEIEDFFDNRFANTSEKDYSVYWKTVKKWAGWLIPDIEWNKIALTEVVHCKSQKEIGVADCQNFCADKWLKKILSLFRGKYIVIVGKVAQAHYETIKEFANGKIILQTSAPSARVKGLTDEVRKQDFYKQVNESKN